MAPQFSDEILSPVDVLRKIEDGAVLIDVRTDSEFNAGHLSGALHIPYDQIANRVAELEESKEKELLLYCRSGHRSGVGVEILTNLGFVKVFNAGCFEDLKKKGTLLPKT